MHHNNHKRLSHYMTSPRRSNSVGSYLTLSDKFYGRNPKAQISSKQELKTNPYYYTLGNYSGGIQNQCFECEKTKKCNDPISEYLAPELQSIKHTLFSIKNQIPPSFKTKPGDKDQRVEFLELENQRLRVENQGIKKQNIILTKQIQKLETILKSIQHELSLCKHNLQLSQTQTQTLQKQSRELSLQSLSLREQLLLQKQKDLPWAQRLFSLQSQYSIEILWRGEGGKGDKGEEGGQRGVEELQDRLCERINQNLKVEKTIFARIGNIDEQLDWLYRKFAEIKQQIM